jgi:3-hydroxyisobutyrate dehydrogenase/2-hydroxy-3-oxopropionate reductase
MSAQLALRAQECQVGVVGLGKMGRPIAERLIDAGYSLHVYNRSQPVLVDLARLGARVADSAAEVADRTDIVLTVLPSVESVEDTYGRFAMVGRPGQVFVDHSTVGPTVSRKCAAMLSARQSSFLDAPLSGGPDGARAGTLTIMVGGDEAVIQRVFPVFRVFGDNIRLCGPVGVGQVVKLVNQLLVGVHTAAACEAAVLGVRLGVDLQVILDLVRTSWGSSTMLTRHVPRFMARDFAGAAPIDTLAKDLGLIRAAAAEINMPLFLGALTDQFVMEARSRGMGGEDIAALVRLWEGASGETTER